MNCSMDEFLCESSKKCILSDWVCDGDRDCDDGFDELNCSKLFYSILILVKFFK